MLIVAFVARHAPTPLFDLRLFRIRSYRIGLIGALLFSAGFFGSWVLLPTFIQRFWGWSVLKTGFALMPASVIAAILSGPIGSVVDRFGHRRVVAVGGMFGGLGWLGFALFMRTEPNFLLGLFLPNVFLGLGMAVLFGMLVSASMRDVPPHRYGMAGAGRTTTFQLAMALGIAVGVAVVGQPLTAGEALSSYRVAWVLSALMLFGVSVVFLFAYPCTAMSRRPARVANPLAQPASASPLRVDAAVGELLAGAVAALVAGQEQHHLRDVEGLTHPPEGDGALGPGPDLRVGERPQARGHGRLDHAGVYRVHPDAVAAPLLRRHLGEAPHRELGCRCRRRGR